MKKTLLILSIAFCLTSNAQLCFSPAVNYPTGTNPFSVCSADFNGDGKMDVALADNGTNKVSVLLNTGSGTFGTSTNYTVGNTPSSVITADFDGDSKMDLAVAN